MSSRMKGATEGHSPTCGDIARYLWQENPNTPVDELAERFKTWKKHGESLDVLPRIQADTPCVMCGATNVYYTGEQRIVRCDTCGRTTTVSTYSVQTSDGEPQ